MTPDFTTLSIQDYGAFPQQTETLQHLLKLEWGSVDPLIQPGVPRPILALDDTSELLGGLTFTSAPSPTKPAPAVWINTVLVIPKYRGKGIATRLIRSAERKARLHNIAKLLVLSELPDLYLKLGWEEIRTLENQIVLRKTLCTTAII